MRIISGKFKGRKFETIVSEGITKPTMDMAKEGLFNILANYFTFDEINTLELFGGTGSISFEFVSRGCVHATVVENNFKCAEFMSNIKKRLNIDDELRIVRYDAMKYLNSCIEKFDIIFADPPYNSEHYEKIKELVFGKEMLLPGGILIFEHDKNHDFSKSIYFHTLKKYGTSIFSFLKPAVEH